MGNICASNDREEPLLKVKACCGSNDREETLLKVEASCGSNDRAKPLLKVEAFRWSSEEFPEKYAVIYTSTNDGTSTCDLRLSANREKAQFEIKDSLCVDEDVSLAVEVTAARDNDGKYILGPHRIGCSHGIKMSTAGNDPFEYGSDKRRGVVNVDIERCDELNLWLELLRVDHSLYFMSDTEPLQFTVKFKFQRNKGLLVELDGPSQNGKLCIHQAEEMNPEDRPNNYSIVKSEFSFPSTDAASSALSATGAINNLNTKTLGRYNHSILCHCVINEASEP